LNRGQTPADRGRPPPPRRPSTATGAERVPTRTTAIHEAAHRKAAIPGATRTSLILDVGTPDHPLPCRRLAMRARGDPTQRIGDRDRDDPDRCRGLQPRRRDRLTIPLLEVRPSHTWVRSAPWRPYFSSLARWC